MTRRCLIVSPHFPPSTVAGVHRARHLAKHLPAHGWEPVVIAVDPAQHVEAQDPELRGLVPAGLRIIETGALDRAAGAQRRDRAARVLAFAPRHRARNPANPA